MTPAKQFVADMLSLIRRDFFAKLTERQFYQERPMLMRAITYPSRWLTDRGVASGATIGLVRRVLMTVIWTIKSKGNKAGIERFSVYFLHCIQRHMQIHGEEYYMAAKAPKSIAALVPGSMEADRRRGQFYGLASARVGCRKPRRSAPGFERPGARIPKMPKKRL